MAKKVYKIDIEAPQFEGGTDTVQTYQAKVDAYFEAVKTKLTEYGYGKDPLFGEIISFGVADGYAQYMVACSRPLRLIHLPVWDAWHYEGANNLTLKDVQAKIAGQKTIEKLFPKRF